MKEQPTEEGFKRYPPNGLYDEAFVCICTISCPPVCCGIWDDECDCMACTARTTDYWESEYE